MRVLCRSSPQRATPGAISPPIARAAITATAARGAAIPDLAGMEKATIVERVREFRDGRRPSTIMRQLANGYTDAQIEAAASYLAAQKR